MTKEEFIKECKNLNIEINEITYNNLNKYYELLVLWNKKFNMTTILEKEQVETILKNYEELNKVGIPMTNFQLLLSVLSKIIMYIIISLIITNI